MAAPTPTKTWQISPNNQVLGTGVEHDHARELFFQFHQAVTGFAQNPWVEAGMSDGVSGGMGVTGLWSAYTDLLWGTGAHSWVVYTHPSGVQILFDMKYSNANCEDMWIAFSPSAGYTGGSASVAPTATDEVVTSATSGLVTRHDQSTLDPWWSGFMTSSVFDDVDLRHHIWHSTDGKVTYWQVWSTNECNVFWVFGEIEDARTNHTVPFAAGGLVQSNTSNSLNVLEWAFLTRARWLQTMIGSLQASLAWCGMAVMDNTAAEVLWIVSTSAAVAEETDGELNVLDIPVISETVGARGPKGKLIDIWWNQYQLFNHGDTSPSNPLTKNFVHVGPLCMPWTGDSTVFLTS